MRNDGKTYINIGKDAKTDLGKTLWLYAGLKKQITYVDEQGKKFKFMSLGGLYEYLRVLNVIKTYNFEGVPLAILEMLDGLKESKGFNSLAVGTSIIRKLVETRRYTLIDFQKDSAARASVLTAMVDTLNNQPKLVKALVENTLPLGSFRVIGYTSIYPNVSEAWVSENWNKALEIVNSNKN